MPIQLRPTALVWIEREDMDPKYRPLLLHVLLTYKSAPGYKFFVKDHEARMVFHKKVERATCGDD
jgi:hypothetical protein